jgi:plasmid stability protein
MAAIHIRDVPVEVHEALRRRAEAQGVSLQRYVLNILEERAEHPSPREVLAEHRRWLEGQVEPGWSFNEATAYIRQLRDTQ